VDNKRRQLESRLKQQQRESEEDSKWLQHEEKEMFASSNSRYSCSDISNVSPEHLSHTSSISSVHSASHINSDSCKMIVFNIYLIFYNNNSENNLKEIANLVFFLFDLNYNAIGIKARQA
jgi:hypothetical protein